MVGAFRRIAIRQLLYGAEHRSSRHGESGFSTHASLAHDRRDAPDASLALQVAGPGWLTFLEPFLVLAKRLYIRVTGPSEGEFLHLANS